MGLAKCVCGRNTDFGTLCVFCSRDRLLDKAEEEAKPDDTSEPEPLQEEHED